jgi:hypothetical protein
MLDQRQSPDKKLLRRLYLGFGMLFNGPISVQCTIPVDDVDGNG